MNTYTSWGRAKRTNSKLARSLSEADSVLPVGNRLSYGDSCLNNSNFLYDNTSNDCLLSFDSKSRLLKAQSGITFDSLLKFLIPRGFFLPVTPGTKYITLGGAVGNDVHGKNHHVDGCFGNWIKRFKLIRSDGDFVCSKSENAELFHASIGGLGLTGLIDWVEFEVIPVQSSFIDVCTIKFSSLEEFFKINNDSVDYKYTVAWVDFFGPQLRGHYIRGNHSDRGGRQLHKKPGLKVIPIDVPTFCLNKYSIKAFNLAYYHKQRSKVVYSNQHYAPFFYPLDSIKNWNFIYGKNGFFQFQCVLPLSEALIGMQKIFDEIVLSGQVSFLSVLKTFGPHKPNGLLSFPMKGATLALDLANKGEQTTQLLDKLYLIVKNYGGRVYPAKDQVLTRELFESFYPDYKKFETFLDPRHSSDWWRRVRSVK